MMILSAFHGAQRKGKPQVCFPLQSRRLNTAWQRPADFKEPSADSVWKFDEPSLPL
ncbi:hypothetical protein [Sphingomonas sp. M1-B02]|uniref:hypothetical protein n=1 Tax=Sphingomonas sp. M1-B02 TaxID=3114300 RepID=UPI00223E9D0E|nr:hypothetical protein [Sphingomonas sp. S6-11]UZK65620.1 hypothetical protein OKW87_14040 [Sphingomonas sp. S6-11]